MKHTLHIALALTLLADFLFYGHPPGGSLGLFALTVLLVLLARTGRRRRDAGTWRMAAYALLLSVVLVWQPGLTAAVLAAGALAVLALKTRTAGVAGVTGWTRLLCVFAALGWTRLFRDLPQLSFASSAPGRIAHVALRWAVPVGLTAGFLALFGLANPVMAKGLDHALRLVNTALAHWLAWPSPLRVLFWVTTGIAIWALLRWRPRRAATAGPASPPRLPGRGFPAAPIIRCLFLFNLAFAAENAVDVVYLWGGAELPGGMTFAAYAHRGAYPLVATALLAAGFVLITFAPRSPAAGHRTARLLVYAWIAQNMLLTFSAAWRLNLYVDAYGLTRLRLAAAFWMLLIAGGLALICWRIVRDRDNGWLLNTNCTQMFAVLTLFAALDTDGMIAWHNVRHCREAGGAGPAFDLAYAGRLGPAALPALRWLAANTSDTCLATNTRGLIALQRNALGDVLSDWRGWTMQRWLLMRDAGGSS